MTAREEYKCKLAEVLERDARYPREAYSFVHAVLDRAQDREGKRDLPLPQRHVSGRELLGALRDVALDEFGPLAGAVLSEWGVTSGSDFGNLVFNLIEARILSASDDDSPADFTGCPDLAGMLDAPFSESGTPALPLPPIDDGP